MAIGENEKFQILEEGLLEPLNRACLTQDSYTREHSAEAIAELLTLAEIQVIVPLFEHFLTTVFAHLPNVVLSFFYVNF